ncbi:inositol monophosphatase [Dysgonomonas sp. 216]|uniref:inositol monophosphatase family protein n=1 Tax=Dysgonomonas sp. 216 TaxID=2302934 RepID=UPI0013D4C8EA|nr:inositol monophosphatase family protein [Dysgonomonas sp. 216]NDW17613.1 inositol monophosphatase [Dysgonomonas sp. 216]
MELKKLTDQVCEVAVKAGKYLEEQRLNFDADKIEEKQEHDYVSYVDQQTEKLLLDELSALLPQAGFVTEEGFGVFNDEEYCWVIDPLDGTTNFINDFAPYCVSIALKNKEELLIGVVYEVCRKECFSAYKGGGAYLDGKQIKVSDIKDMGKSLIGLELPYNVSFKPALIHLINDLYGKASSLRINGSAAMSLCYVACGRYGAWLEAYLKTWDYSAGVLIVEEAGGTVTNLSGGNLKWGEHNLIASNGHFHTYLVDLLKPLVSDLK